MRDHFRRRHRKNCLHQRPTYSNKIHHIATDEIKVTLWREATLFQTNIGQYVTLTHVTVHEFNGQKSLNSTRHSEIQVTEARPETIEIVIYGVENTKGDITTLTTQVANTDSFQSMDIQNDILIKWFRLDETAEDIGDALIHSLPQTCYVIFCNDNIIQILKEKSEEELE